MSAEKLPPGEDVEEQAALPAAGGLSAAKEKSGVEETEDDATSGGPNGDDASDDDGGSEDDEEGDAGDGEDADPDDGDDESDDDGDDSDGGDPDDDDSGDEDEDAGNGEVTDPEEGGKSAGADDREEDQEIEDIAEGQAEAIEPPVAATDLAGDVSVTSEEDGDETEIGGTAAKTVEPSAAAELTSETVDGSDAAVEHADRKEVEDVAAETVDMPVPVLAASPPQITDVMSSDHVQHLRLLEALLFAGTQALDEKELADRLPNDADLPRLLADLAELYANRGINLVKVAGGYAFRTAPDLSEKLKIERPVTRKLSRASVETLAIIAFHQPVTRAEIEQVRGVGLSKGTLDLLFEQNWIRPMGRRRAPGKPVTWGTTDFFLEHFGLASLDDLPGHEEMRAAGLLDPRAQPPIFRPEEPDLPLEPTEDETVEPLAVEEQKP